MSTLRRHLFALSAVPLLLLGALFAGSATPLPVEAASCTLAFRLFDADATNNGATTPGGTASSLAYPGYTNAAKVGIDLKSTSPTGCATFGTTNWYTIFSIWHEAIAGKTTGWLTADPTLADNYAQVDQVPNANITTAVAYDYKNDMGAGTVSPAVAAFDLTAANTYSPTQGGVTIVYGEVTRCGAAQSTTAGFAPAYARRLAASAANNTIGAYYWLNNTVGNAYSVYLATAGGTELAGGGGKGSCLAPISAASSAGIVYDSVAPVITDLTTTAGFKGSTTAVVSLDSAQVVEGESGLWLMAFTNSPTCTATVGTYSPWELYAATKSGWDITSATYGGNGLSTDGVRTVCMRVMDKAGNIGFFKGSITLDRVLPTLTSFTTTNSSPVAASAATYQVKFSEAMYGLTGSDFTNTGTATGCRFSVASTATVGSYTLTVSGCVNGVATTATLVPRLTALSSTDIAGSAGPATAASGPSLTIDLPPVVTTLVLQAAADTGVSNSDGLTKATSLVYDLVFNEAISNLAAADFANSGSARNCLFLPSAATGTTLTISVNSCGEGTVILSLKAGSVLDALTQTGPITAKVAATVTIDRTLPTLQLQCATSAGGRYNSCPTSSTAATLYVRLSASDAGSSFGSDAIGTPTALASCSVYSSTVVAGADQVKTFACSTRGTYVLSTTVNDRAGNTSSPAAATFTLQ